MVKAICGISKLLIYFEQDTYLMLTCSTYLILPAMGRLQEIMKGTIFIIRGRKPTRIVC